MIHSLCLVEAGFPNGLTIISLFELELVFLKSMNSTRNGEISDAG